MWAMEELFAVRAASIIHTATWLCLATTDGVRAYANPFFFSQDSDLNLYFLVPTKDALTQRLSQNPLVGVAIFDPAQPSGTAEGVQVEALASVVEGPDLPALLSYHVARRNPNAKPKRRLAPKVDDFRARHLLGFLPLITRTPKWRLMKLTPIHVYTRDTRVARLDQRVEVFLHPKVT